MSATGEGDTLGVVGEAGVLSRIFPRLPQSASTLLGPGDDAAVIAAPDGRFVVTTDMMIHGPDFRLAWSTPFDLGWKAAATNLSDVAAMGAVPTALVVALAAPADTPVTFHEGFADGLREACAELAPGCGVVGGDLSVSDTLTIAVTAFGDLESRPPVTRSGARAGDVVAVAGALGLAGAGLRMLFEHGLTSSPDRGGPEIEAQLQPRPPISLGPVAALAGATSMIDLSDGLALDAARVAAASGVAFALHALSAIELDGGEDHALLATFAGEVPEGFRVIGRVVEGTGVLVDGRPYEPGGWDPFTGWNGETS
jgi:thiamine-monophosphate kinase